MKTTSIILSFLISFSSFAFAQDTVVQADSDVQQKEILIKAMESEVEEMIRDQEQIGYMYEDSQGKLSAAGQLIEIATNTIADAKKLAPSDMAKIEEYLKVIEQMHNEVHFMAHSE